jgi:hypothetical protein
MKKSLLIFLLVFISAVAVASDRKNNRKEDKKADSVPVYIWGVSMSFSDSTVYFTEIQELDSVVLQNGALPHLQYYSYELKDYMSFEENMPGRISVIYFNEKRSKLEKKELKVKKHLIEKEGKIVRYLGDKFKFVKP